MKKLMMAVAIVCATAFAQGAQVTWKSSNMASHNGSVSAGAMTMYIWEITEKAYQTLLTKSTDAKTLSQYVYDNYDQDAATLLKNSTKVSATKAAMTVTGADDKDAGQSVYAAILIVDNNDDYFMGNLYTGTVPDAGNLTAQALGTNIGGNTTAAATAWETVPEPFSGTLALLGMGAIALRRKMKKAKAKKA